jgi:hypothetical protein
MKGITMKRATILTTIAALAATILLAAPGTTATTKPNYQAPTNVTSPFPTDDNTSLELIWTASPYADFYTVKYSTRSDMDNARRYYTDVPSVNAVTIDGLTPGKRYYVQVAVVNSQRDRLSSYSIKRSFVTQAGV